MVELMGKVPLPVMIITALVSILTKALLCACFER